MLNAMKAKLDAYNTRVWDKIQNGDQKSMTLGLKSRLLRNKLLLFCEEKKTQDSQKSSFFKDYMINFQNPRIPLKNISGHYSFITSLKGRYRKSAFSWEYEKQQNWVSKHTNSLKFHVCSMQCMPNQMLNIYMFGQ